LSPVGILLTCAVLACAGLLLTSRVNTFLFALVALGVYAVGKTFFWPTMLAVASDRFPRTGAVAISIMGGIGMMSAGLIGAPGRRAGPGFRQGPLRRRSPPAENPRRVQGVQGGQAEHVPLLPGIDRPGRQEAGRDSGQTDRGPRGAGEGRQQGPAGGAGQA